jgi:outer membrane biosynthesis protein TonB
MKFIKLESRGGNYLVVASNVAWLRTAENGQTNVGIVGGQPLLVVGSVEEVAAKILAGLSGQDETAPAAPAAPVQAPAAPAPAPATPAPAPQQVAEPAPPPPALEPEPEPIAMVQEPEPEPEPEPAPVVAEEPEPEPAPAPEPVRLPAKIAAAPRPRPAVAGSASLWERPATSPAAKGLKIKASSQRMMGMLE